MTRSKIQKLKFFIFLLIFLLAQTAICDGNFREKRDTPLADVDRKAAVAVDENAGAKERPGDKDGQRNAAGLAADARKPALDGNKTHDDITKPDVAAAANKTAHTVDTSNEFNEGHTSFNTGAVIRGFLVFAGLSILVMVYIVFRVSVLRFSKTRAQLVRKYGVLTHRQDVEMRPLPLEEEDDEDTTVFDASNVTTINAQHQNA